MKLAKLSSYYWCQTFIQKTNTCTCKFFKPECDRKMNESQNNRANLCLKIGWWNTIIYAIFKPGDKSANFESDQVISF